MSRYNKLELPKLHEGQSVFLDGLNKDCLVSICRVLRDMDNETEVEFNDLKAKVHKKKGQWWKDRKKLDNMQPLSALVALSMCNKALRAASGLVLRRRVVLEQRKNPHAALAYARKVLASLPAAEKTNPTHTLKILYWQWPETDTNRVALSNTLTSLLRTFAHLRKLQIQIPFNSMLRQRLVYYVSERKITLPSVVTLSVSPGCAFFIDMCPNVECLVAPHIFGPCTKEDQQLHLKELVTRAHALPKLRGLEIRDTWGTSILQDIRVGLPGLSWLVLGSNWFGPSPSPSNLDLAGILSDLSQMPSLEKLALPDQLHMANADKARHIFMSSAALKYLCFGLRQQAVFKKSETGVVSCISPSRGNIKNSCVDFWGLDMYG